MKYLKQFFIIISISFAGELLNALIPLPIASGIYGIIIMLLCLQTKLLKVSDVKETSTFLVEIMQVMFIPATVGLMDSWGLIRKSWTAYTVIIVVSLVAVMVISGKVTQWMLRKKGKDERYV